MNFVNGLRALAELTPIGSIISGAAARYRRGLQGPAIHDHRRRTRLASGKLTQQTAQVLDHDFKAVDI
jgi:hypothetical protein